MTRAPASHGEPESPDIRNSSRAAILRVPWLFKICVERVIIEAMYGRFRPKLPPTVRLSHWTGRTLRASAR